MYPKWPVKSGEWWFYQWILGYIDRQRWKNMLISFFVVFSYVTWPWTPISKSQEDTKVSNIHKETHLRCVPTFWISWQNTKKWFSVLYYFLGVTLHHYPKSVEHDQNRSICICCFFAMFRWGKGYFLGWAAQEPTNHLHTWKATILFLWGIGGEWPEQHYSGKVTFVQRVVAKKNTNMCSNPQRNGSRLSYMIAAMANTIVKKGLRGIAVFEVSYLRKKLNGESTPIGFQGLFWLR